MLSKGPGIVVALLLLAALPMYVGCASDASGQTSMARTACDQPQPQKKPCGFCDAIWGKCAEHATAQSTPCDQPEKKPCGLCDWLEGKKCAEHAKAEYTPEPAPLARVTSQDLPPNGVEGECYAKVFIPAEYKTVTERNLVKEASERIEITPAEYKWVEEQVLVKEASRQLVEVPAEYKWVDKTVCVKPAHSGWVMEKKTRCAGDTKPRDVFCLVSTPAEYKTVRSQVLVKPACTREETIPAEYSTVRRQIVAVPASTKKVCIAAEYADVERTVMVADSTIKWEHIVCEEKVTADTVNKVKIALAAAGYTPGPLNGQLAAADWSALTEFQKNNRIGVGELSYETLTKLGVPTE